MQVRPWLCSSFTRRCVSLNIIWRWPRSSTVDSPPSPLLSLRFPPPTPFDASLIQRPCDYVSAPASLRVPGTIPLCFFVRMYSLLSSFLSTSLNFLSFLFPPPPSLPPLRVPSPSLWCWSFAPRAFYSSSLKEEKPNEERPLILLSSLLLLRLFQSCQLSTIGRHARELPSFMHLTLRPMNLAVGTSGVLSRCREFWLKIDQSQIGRRSVSHN